MVVLKDEVWLAIANKRDYLCFECMELRLGRDVAPDDLKPCSLTETMRLGYVIYSRANMQP